MTVYIEYTNGKKEIFQGIHTCTSFARAGGSSTVEIYPKKDDTTVLLKKIKSIKIEK